MARHDHLDTLRRHLRRGAELTPADVAARLGLDERQARRVVRDLDAAGPPLRVRTAGRRKFYGYAPEDLSLLDTAEPLTEGEAFAVYMAVATARPAFSASPLADVLDAAVAKLVPPDGTLLFEPDDARFAAIGPGAQAVDPGVFAALRRAVRGALTVTMAYTNARGRRRDDYRCDPYGIVVAGGSWQLVGRDHTRDAVVRYALPDVEAVRVGEPFGGPPAGFDLEAVRARDARRVLAAARSRRSGSRSRPGPRRRSAARPTTRRSLPSSRAPTARPSSRSRSR